MQNIQGDLNISKNETKNIYSNYMKKTQKFIAILYDILENSTHQQIIHWTGNGRAFIIEKKIEFSQSIMQESFSTQNYNSFLRQLGVYGFKMRKNEKKKKEYFHSYFTKGNKLALYKIQRKRKSNNEESIHAINENIKQQLIDLRAQQTNLLRQFSIQCQIQQMIAKKVHFMIDVFINLCKYFSQSMYATHYEKYQQPMILFFRLIPGYIPELSDQWVQSFSEICDPITPIHDIANTPEISQLR